MAEVKSIRLNKVLKEFNISLDRAVDFLKSKSIEIEARPTAKISDTEYKLLSEGFAKDKEKKVESKEVGEEKRKEKEELFNDREREREEQEKRRAEADAAAKLAAEKAAAEKAAADAAQKVVEAKATLKGPKKVGKVDLDAKGNVKPKEKQAPEVQVSENKNDTPDVQPETATKKETAKKIATPLDKEAAKAVKTKKEAQVTKDTEPEAPVSDEAVTTQYKKLNGPNFTGQKIDLTQFKKPEKKKPAPGAPGDKKGRRRRITKEAPKGGSPANAREKRGPVRRAVQRANVPKVEPTEEDIQKQVRETLEKLKGKSSKGKGVKYRREKRDIHRQKTEDELAQQAIDNKVLKVTEFVTA
ncbi:MAG: translation initiation factor IF-2, partial [Bacteroidetes bacterium]|nr:translation initiation factor IF-2 [Bacteroidota bacterium]